MECWRAASCVESEERTQTDVQRRKRTWGGGICGEERFVFTVTRSGCSWKSDSDWDESNGRPGVFGQTRQTRCPSGGVTSHSTAAAALPSGVCCRSTEHTQHNTATERKACRNTRRSTQGRAVSGSVGHLGHCAVGVDMSIQLVADNPLWARRQPRRRATTPRPPAIATFVSCAAVSSIST